MVSIEALGRLDRWFATMCNGDWEHTYGVTLQTIDNPGWMLEVELTDTPLVNRLFSEVKEQSSDSDWIHCAVSQDLFRGSGSVGNLGRILDIFLDWAE